MQHWSEKSLLAENDARRNPLAKTTHPSIVTDAEGDPHANATKEIVLGNKRANSKPQGDHNVFTHCAKNPNCDVCRVTKTSRARCKNRPLKRSDAISRLSSFGDLITGDRKILDGYSCTQRNQDAHEATSCLRRFPHPFQKPGRIFTDK